MANRKLISYTEDRLPHGPFWILEVDRSASGEPTLLITIKERQYDRNYAHLDREMTIVVGNADEVLAPAMEWLAERRELFT